MRMLEGINTTTEMVMDVDQVGDLREVTLISLSIHGDFRRQNKGIHNFEWRQIKKGFQKIKGYPKTSFVLDGFKKALSR